MTFRVYVVYTQWKGEIRRPRRTFEMVKCAWSEIDIEPIFSNLLFPFYSAVHALIQCDRT